MTYKELLEDLKQLPEERLDDVVSVMDPYTSEITAIVHTRVAEEGWDDGVIDIGHLYLVMKA